MFARVRCSIHRARQTGYSNFYTRYSFTIYGTLESLGALTYQRFNGCNHGLAILCALALVPLRAIEDIHERALQPAADSFERDAAAVPPC